MNHICLKPPFLIESLILLIEKSRFSCRYQKFFVSLHAICVQGKMQSLNNTNMADILQTIEHYRSLGIEEQIPNGVVEKVKLNKHLGGTN